VTYTPAAGYSGPDSFTFKANDGTADSNTATVSITVTKANHPPVAQNESVTTTGGVPVVVTLEATDADNDPLTFSIVGRPGRGSLGPVVGNKVTYTPAAGCNGRDSFTFKANDGKADSNIATVTITVTKANHAPVADDETVTTEAGSAVTVTLHAGDADGDALTFAIASEPRHGTLGAVGGNRVVYTPAPGYSGEDSFTFRANDGTADSNTATVGIAVQAPKPPTRCEERYSSLHRAGDGHGGEDDCSQPCYRDRDRDCDSCDSHSSVRHATRKDPFARPEPAPPCRDARR